MSFIWVTYLTLIACLSICQFGVSSQTNWIVFGPWEETGRPGENPQNFCLFAHLISFTSAHTYSGYKILQKS